MRTHQSVPYLSIIVVISFSSVGIAFDGEDKPIAPIPEIFNVMGDWEVESSKTAAKEKKNAPTAQVRITTDRIVLIDNGKTELEADFRIDGSKRPKHVDVTVELNKGDRPYILNIKGIFKRDNDKMVLCLNGNPKGERPKEFVEPTKENGLMVFELKRVRESK